MGASLRPRTAREALLEIRRLCALELTDAASLVALDEVARDGLACDGLADFELTDRLADRLAEAHDLLRGRLEGIEDAEAEGRFSPQFMAKLRGALALPPDLEVMVERRRGIVGSHVPPPRIEDGRP
jgi:hypothetical protein